MNQENKSLKNLLPYFYDFERNKPFIFGDTYIDSFGDSTYTKNKNIEYMVNFHNKDDINSDDFNIRKLYNKSKMNVFIRDIWDFYKRKELSNDYKHYSFNKYFQVQEILKFINLPNKNLMIYGKYLKNNDIYKLIYYNNILAFLVMPHERYLRFHELYIPKTDTLKILKFKANIPLCMFSLNPFNGRLKLCVYRKDRDTFQHWPYGNVYGSSEICFGDTGLGPNSFKYIHFMYTDDENIKYIDLDVYMDFIYKSIFSSVFNNDLTDTYNIIKTLASEKTGTLLSYQKNVLVKEEPYEIKEYRGN